MLLEFPRGLLNGVQGWVSRPMRDLWVIIVLGFKVSGLIFFAVLSRSFFARLCGRTWCHTKVGPKTSHETDKGLIYECPICASTR